MFHVKHQRSRTPREWTAQTLYALALRYLAPRPRSEREVANRLRRSGADEELVAPVIERLRFAGLLDDDAFASGWVEGRSSASPRGARLLAYELRGKGVPTTAIAAALEDLPDEDDLARAAAAGKIRSLAQQPDDVFARRLGSFLERRGFDSGTVTRLVAQAVAERTPEQA